MHNDYVCDEVYQNSILYVKGADCLFGALFWDIPAGLLSTG